MKRIRIFIEYIAAFFIIFLLLFAIASAVIIKYYGQEVKEYTMELINEQVDTKIHMKEMGISVFRKFPYTSLFFNEVIVWSGHGFDRSEFPGISTDTLFTAENIYLQFNIIDLVRKRYTVKNLEARNGVIRIFSDSFGRGNYSVVKSKNESSDSFLFSLKGVHIKDFEAVYVNKAKSIKSDLHVNDILFEGNFSRVKYQLITKIDANINSLKNNDIQYISKQTLESEISLFVDKNIYTISRGGIQLGELEADVEGEFLVTPDGTTDLGLAIKGEKADIAWLADILEKNGVSGMERFRVNGSLNFSAQITGLLSSILTPHIQAGFNTSSTEVSIGNFPFPISDLELKGQYDNGLHNNSATSSLILTSFSATINESLINGTMQVSNFMLPRFKIDLKGDFELSDLETMFPDLPLKKAGGSISPVLTIDGMITGINEGDRGVTFVPEGTVSFQEVNFTLTENPLEFHEINGKVGITSTAWNYQLEGLVGISDITLKGASSNPLDHFLNGQPLSVKASLSSYLTDIDDITSKFKKRSGGGDFNFPKDIGLELDIKVEELVQAELEGKNVTAHAVYAYPGIYLDKIYLEALHGSIEGEASLNCLDMPDCQLWVSSGFSEIRIDELIKTFHGFGQQVITEKNLKGNLSGNINLTSPVDKEFKLSPSNIISDSYFRIENGELINFKPAIEMSKFLKIDKMDHIYFSTLENRIIIKNNMIQIPEMEIASSALDLKASGTQSFNKNYNYHLAIKLSDLLFRKAQSTSSPEFEVALDENDKRTIFLRLFDEGDGMMVEFDEEEAMKKIRNDLKEERSELKVILNEEFGIFKNDEAVKDHSAPEEPPIFKFEFPDDDLPDTIRTEEKPKTRRTRKERENKQRIDFVIEQDL